MVWVNEEMLILIDLKQVVYLDKFLEDMLNLSKKKKSSVSYCALRHLAFGLGQLTMYLIPQSQIFLSLFSAPGAFLSMMLMLSKRKNARRR